MLDEKKTYRALQTLGIDSARVEIGDLVDLSDEQAAAFGEDYIEPAYQSENKNTNQTEEK